MPDQLTPGSPAPDFTLTDQHGDSVSLGDHAGRKVLVFFYPKASTPGCTTQACGLRDVADDIGDTVVLGISPDLPPKLEKFDAKHDLGFTLLSDPEHRTAEAYGVWGEKKLYGKVYMGIVRSSFLIDECRPHRAGLVQDQPEGHSQEAALRARRLTTRRSRRAVRLAGRTLCGQPLSVRRTGVALGGSVVPVSVPLFVGGEESRLELLVGLGDRPLASCGREADRDRDQDQPPKHVGSAVITGAGVGHVVRIGPFNRYSLDPGPGGGMADAADSKSAVRKGVWVQVPPRAPAPPLGSPHRASPASRTTPSGHSSRAGRPFRHPATTGARRSAATA